MKKQTRKPPKKSTDQVSEFKRLARSLECNESEAAFDTALKQLKRPKLSQAKKR